MYTHANTDFDNAMVWTNMGRFDIAETLTTTPGPDYSVLRNGVLHCTGACTSYTEETVDASTTTAADVNFTDTLSIGYFVPYYNINWTLSTAQVGGSVAYSYPTAADGSGVCSTWASLTL
jgi:hypothetical protein